MISWIQLFLRGVFYHAFLLMHHNTHSICKTKWRKSWIVSCKLHKKHTPLPYTRMKWLLSRETCKPTTSKHRPLRFVSLFSQNLHKYTSQERKSESEQIFSGPFRVVFLDGCKVSWTAMDIQQFAVLICLILLLIRFSKSVSKNIFSWLPS